MFEFGMLPQSVCCLSFTEVPGEWIMSIVDQLAHK